MSIDAKGFVWIGGNGEKDGQYLKFTRDGKFVLQIGKQGDQTNSNDVTRLGKPADAEVDPETNEVYIADGYFNHRVIVFDADSGTYKRHWGAYGKKPTDEKLEPYNLGVIAIQQSRPLRENRKGWPGLCVRPRQQSHPGLPQGRHLR